jgi:hypothetical protein
MAKFIVPNPMILNGKLREIINLERISSFSFLKSTQQNYGYIKFSFDKGHEHVWAYANDEQMKSDLQKIYGMLEIAWEESTF